MSFLKADREKSTIAGHVLVILVGSETDNVGDGTVYPLAWLSPCPQPHPIPTPTRRMGNPKEVSFRAALLDDRRLDGPLYLAMTVRM